MSKSKPQLINVQGASIVQVIVASGLFAAVFLGMINLMQEQALTSQSSSRELEMVYVTDEIRSLLSNPNTCLASLKGLNPLSSKTDSLQRPLGKGEYLEVFPTIRNDKKATYGQKNLKIMSYELSDKNSEVHVEAGTTEFIITYATLDETPIKQKRHLRIYISLDQDGSISNCQTTPGLTQTSSTNNKKQDLWTNSVARGGHYSRVPLVLGLNKLQAPNFNFMPTGLDQSSGLMLLSEGAERICTRALEGALRYNASSRQIQLCSNNQTWLEIPTYNFDPLQAKIFSTSSQQETKLDISTRRYCTLIKADASSGQCSLSQGLTNNWQLQASGQNTKCQALCY